MVISPLQQQIKQLQERSNILDSILAIAKTPGGQISDDGKNIYFTLRKAGMTKGQIAKILNVTPAALTKYGDPD